MQHGKHSAQHAKNPAAETEGAPMAAGMRNACDSRESHVSEPPAFEMGGEADVVYPDASSLKKPQTPVMRARIVIALFVVVAAVVGGLFLTRFVDTVFHAAEREQETVQANISRDVALDLPVVANYMSYDDASISQEFTNLGYQIYEISSSATTPGEDLDLFKFPSDMIAAEGALLYAQGVSSLSAADASRVLTGSWRFTAERGDQTSMRVRYVDFSSGTLDAAVGAAMASQGYDEATVTNSGVDESGNLVREGTLTLEDGREASWRVAAIELEHVYDISGLPDSAVYVGIRVTA